MRATSNVPAGANDADRGSQISADARSERPEPPTTRTRPSGRAVAVCCERAVASDPAGLKEAVAGSQISAKARGWSRLPSGPRGSWSSVGSAPWPPMIRTRPSGRGVAVWETRDRASEPVELDDEWRKRLGALGYGQ